MAHDDLVDIGSVDSGAPYGRTNYLRTELRRLEATEGPHQATGRGTNSRDDHRIAHLIRLTAPRSAHKPHRGTGL